MANYGDRRTKKRIPCWANTSLDWNGILETAARCLNVSERGIAVETYDVLDLRQGMTLTVRNDTQSRSATVRHFERRGMKCILGLEFLPHP